MREVVAVGRAHGVAPSETYPDERLAFTDTMPAELGTVVLVVSPGLRVGHGLKLTDDDVKSSGQTCRPACGTGVD